MKPKQSLQTAGANVIEPLLHFT